MPSNATERGPAVAVRIAGRPTEAGTFTVQSASEPGQSWVVEWVSAGTHHCFCPRFAQAGRCRHSLAVFEAIATEWRERKAAERQAHIERIAS